MQSISPIPSLHLTFAAKKKPAKIARQKTRRTEAKPPSAPAIIVIEGPAKVFSGSGRTASILDGTKSQSSLFRDTRSFVEAQTLFHRLFPRGAKTLWLGAADGREAYSQALCLTQQEVLRTRPTIAQILRNDLPRALKIELGRFMHLGKKFPIKSIEQHGNLTQLSQTGIFELGARDTEAFDTDTLQNGDYSLRALLRRWSTGTFNNGDYLFFNKPVIQAAGTFETGDIITTTDTLKPNTYGFIGARNVMDYLMQDRGAVLTKKVIDKCFEALIPGGLFMTGGELTHPEHGPVLRDFIERKFYPVPQESCSYNISPYNYEQSGSLFKKIV